MKSNLIRGVFEMKTVEEGIKASGHQRLFPTHKVPFAVYISRTRLSTTSNVNPSVSIFNAQSK